MQRDLDRTDAFDALCASTKPSNTGTFPAGFKKPITVYGADAWIERAPEGVLCHYAVPVRPHDDGGKLQRLVARS